ncbi:hypothetical protein, partial [Marinifilum sp. D737]|uniref:hypothetical protein n=1 Tax=Marinifilum sp. D737 TaxID=2969628 RepID=UPI002274B9D7
MSSIQLEKRFLNKLFPVAEKSIIAPNVSRVWRRAAVSAGLLFIVLLLKSHFCIQPSQTAACARDL